VDEGDVCPVQRDLQGHPESVSILADKVKIYLKNDINLKSPVHEPCLYIGSYERQATLIGHQVDDFNAAGLQEDKLLSLFAFLKTNINIFAEVGIMCHYNGIDIVQARNYGKIHDESYIDKILKVHGWDTSSLTKNRLGEPIRPSAVRELEGNDSPDTEAEYITIEKAAGFPYRSSMG
jgi:hypothetical protein